MPSDFLNYEILHHFYIVTNYVRNLYMFEDLYPERMDDEVRSELEYARVQLKLYLLIFDSDLSGFALAKILSTDTKNITPKTIYDFLSTTKKLMDYTTLAKVHYTALQQKINDFDKEAFYRRCVEVLSRTSGINYRVILAYKRWDGSLKEKRLVV